MSFPVKQFMNELFPDSASLIREHDEKSFRLKALEVYRFQFTHNPVYASFSARLGRDPLSVHSIEEIPFLPVELFKNHRVYCGESEPANVFLSSGTTGMERSRHMIRDISLYETSFTEGFSRFYGNIGDYRLIALLPSYTERAGSSLVYMAGRLISLSGDPGSGFFAGAFPQLFEIISEGLSLGRKVLLLGVSFELLRMAEEEIPHFPGLTVMETGGMKGRGEEMTREELHEILCKCFKVNAIHSEYGMTELLSQAYSPGHGRFHAPPWMRVLIRDPNDPLSYLPRGKTGGINIIDLANVYSCSFLSTQDLGMAYADGSFTVSGRFDYSDIRGCNLLSL
jgi:phenylacetate-coenzyme A ligase PaaK-like adenylate-forming protein